MRCDMRPVIETTSTPPISLTTRRRKARIARDPILGAFTIELGASGIDINPEDNRLRL